MLSEFMSVLNKQMLVQVIQLLKVMADIFKNKINGTPKLVGLLVICFLHLAGDKSAGQEFDLQLVSIGNFTHSAPSNKTLIHYAPIELNEDNRSMLNKIISIDVIETPMEIVLKQIADLADIRIAFSRDVNREKWQKPVSMQYDQATVLGAMYAALGDSDLRLTLTSPTGRGHLVVASGAIKHKSSIEPPVDVSLQYGTIAGMIRDANTGEALIGATVVLEGTALGSAVDPEGNYRIRRVPEGTHTLIIRYLGYVTKRAEITVIAGQAIEHNIELQPDVVEGEDIVIHGQALAQAHAIRRQLNSNTIVNVVSESRLRELPDANAAESVGRLPGVSIIRNAGEGQNVAIRGLGPQYNSVTIDGDRVTSTDLGGRSVDLSMISPEMLSGIELFKVLRPDMDADAIGGSVNFQFSGAPSENQYRISLSSGYHNQIGGVGTYKGSASGSARFFNDRLGVLGTVSSQRIDRSSHVFSASYLVLRDRRPDEEHAPIGINNLRLIDRIETRERHGAGLNLDYKIPGGRLYFNNFYSRLNRDETSVLRNYRTVSRQEHIFRDRQIHIDILSNSLRGEHEILNGFVKLDWRISRNESSQNQPFDNRLTFVEYSAMDSDLLDITKGPDHLAGIFYNKFEESFLQTGDHFTSKARERDLTASIDFEIPIRIGNQITGYIKTGGKYYDKDRIRENSGRLFRQYGLTPAWPTYPIVGADDGFPWQDGDNTKPPNILQFFDLNPYDILDGKYEMALNYDREMHNAIWYNYGHLYAHNVTPRFNDFEATERLAAGYIMTEINIGNRLMILPGIRYERENSDYMAYMASTTVDHFHTDEEYFEEFERTLEEINANRNNDKWFPMIQGRYRATNWFDVRLARTESTSRPSFTDLNPRLRINHGAGSVSRGNPFLKMPKATNYDLFLTFHSNRVGLLAIGGFYKEIENLIYQRNAVIHDPEKKDLTIHTRFYDISEPVNNPNLTTIRGFETEWQSNLTWLPKPFNGLVINANFSRIFSETQYPQFYQERGPQGFVPIDTFRVGPMVYQPDFIANISLGYDIRGFSVRVSMLYQGATLSSVGTRPETDSFVEDYQRWDLALKQSFFNNSAIVFMNVHNMTNRRDLSMQFTREFPTDMEYYSWSIDLGIRLQL
jgi:TonB-dependent receptor